LSLERLLCALNYQPLFCRYLVFYSPFDIVYKLTKRTPFKVALVTLKEIHRTHKIYDGVHSTAKAHPGAWIVIVVCGSLKGAAAGIMRTAEQLVRGVWAPAGNELLRPTLWVASNFAANFNLYYSTTKACVLAAIVFAAESKRGLLPAPHDIIFLAVVGRVETVHPQSHNVQPSSSTSNSAPCSSASLIRWRHSKTSPAHYLWGAFGMRSGMCRVN
jgi:hypothetical protein